MKRYWKIAVLVPFIVLCIGSYYIDAASSGYPEYYLKLQSGDEKEAVGISLMASYPYQENSYYPENLLTIRPEGSVYKSEESFWSWITMNRYYRPELAKLQKEHRQFMRGKSDADSFYEDDKVLGFAELGIKFDSLTGKINYSFIVSVEDKKQQSSVSFEVTVPQENDYRMSYIVDMQIVGQTMNLITMNYKPDEAVGMSNNSTKILLYKLDLAKKNIVSDQVLLTNDSANLDDPTEIIALSESPQAIIPNRYTLFKINHLKKGKPRDVKGMYITDKQELVYYDLQSNKLVPIQVAAIDDLMKKSSLLDITYSQGKLMLSYQENSSAIRVMRYNIAENKVIGDLTIDTKHSLEDGERFYYQEKANNRLYMMGNLAKDSKKAPIIVIADLETGKILYDGYIARKDNKPISKLRLGNILIKE